VPLLEVVARAAAVLLVAATDAQEGACARSRLRPWQKKNSSPPSLLLMRPARAAEQSHAL
jgi:hypothetical protein